MLRSTTVMVGNLKLAEVLDTTADRAMLMSLRAFDINAKYFANPKLAGLIHSKQKPKRRVSTSAVWDD